MTLWLTLALGHALLLLLLLPSPGQCQSLFDDVALTLGATDDRGATGGGDDAGGGTSGSLFAFQVEKKTRGGESLFNSESALRGNAGDSLFGGPKVSQTATTTTGGGGDSGGSLFSRHYQQQSVQREETTGGEGEGGGSSLFGGPKMSLSLKEMEEKQDVPISGVYDIGEKSKSPTTTTTTTTNSNSRRVASAVVSTGFTNSGGIPGRQQGRKTSLFDHQLPNDDYYFEEEIFYYDYNDDDDDKEDEEDNDDGGGRGGGTHHQASSRDRRPSSVVSRHRNKFGDKERTSTAEFSSPQTRGKDITTATTSARSDFVLPSSLTRRVAAATTTTASGERRRGDKNRGGRWRSRQGATGGGGKHRFQLAGSDDGEQKEDRPEVSACS